jgi:Flp pilus assembly protein TadD
VGRGPSSTSAIRSARSCCCARCWPSTADRGLRLLAARAWFASAQLRKARTALAELLAEYPDDAYARVLLGRTLQRLGRHEEAGAHLRLGGAMTPAYAG